MLGRLYQSDEVADVFKKALTEELFKAIYIDSYFAEAAGEDRSAIFSFSPGRYKISRDVIKRYGNYIFRAEKHIRLARYGLILGACGELVQKIIYAAASVVYLAGKSLLLLLGKIRGSKKAGLVFHNVVAIDMPFQGVFADDRSARFLLGREKVTAQNTLFLVNCPLDRSVLRDGAAGEYAIFYAQDACGGKNLVRTAYDLGFLRHAFGSVSALLCWGQGPLALYRAFFSGLRTYIDWSLILQRIKFRNYIYTNNESLLQQGANIMMRKSGARSWNYAVFLGGGYIYAAQREEFRDKRHILWSFLNSDCFVGMNDEVVAYYKLHRQSIPDYHAVGCLFSQSIQEIQGAALRENFIRKYFKHPFDGKMKLISVFDTSFIGLKGVSTDYDDCIGFYEDIARLLAERKDLLIAVKPSKPDAWFVDMDYYWASLPKGRKICDLFAALKSDPRVFWAWGDTRGGLNFTYNNQVIAASDLVVTHCLSSPTAEALGARKKAIWYESSGKHRGVMYDQIPGLCAHGYDELAAAVDKLLYKTTEQGYQDYLDRHIKSKIEAYLDGSALTRFHKLLAEDDAG